MYALCKGYIVYTFYVSNIRFLNKRGKKILYMCVHIITNVYMICVCIISLFAFVYLRIVFGSAPPVLLYICVCVIKYDM